jgi:hypothetical protein
VVAVAAGVVSLSSCRGRAPATEAAASFSVDEVPTESPGLAVTVTNVRGQLHEGYMDWACLVRCNDPDGCSADLHLTVHYTSAGSPATIDFAGPIDVPMGARARLGGVQRPPRAVDGVDRVVIEAKPRRGPGEPAPTPRI